MKKIIAYMFFLTVLVVAISNTVCQAEDGINIKITNGDLEKEINLTTSLENEIFDIDYTQDLSIEVLDKETIVRFGQIIDNVGYISSEISDNRILTVMPHQDSKEERAIIVADDVEYSLIYKRETQNSSIKRIYPEDCLFPQYDTKIIGLNTAYSAKNADLSAISKVNEGLDYSRFEEKYLGEKDGVLYLGIYLLDNDNIDEQSLETEFPIEIIFERTAYGGGYEPLNLGKDIRVYNIGSDTTELVYTETGVGGQKIDITTNKIGTFAIVYNKNAFSSRFFLNFNQDSDSHEQEIYKEINNISKSETEIDMVKPERDGYTFVKWTRKPDGDGMPLKEGDAIVNDWYACWMKNEEFNPLNVNIKADSSIKKGQENNKTILLSTSIGTFNDLENAKWKVIGSNELSISNAEKIDDRTIKLTLAGNSTDISNNCNIAISFNSDALVHDIPKIDIAGKMKVEYTSDNYITIKKESGGSSNRTGKITSSQNDMAPTPTPIVNGIITTPVPVTDYVHTPIKIVMTIGNKFVQVDEKSIENDVAPVLKNNRTMLPVRFIAESLGGKVEWDDVTKQVTITRDSSVIILSVGSDIMYVNERSIMLDAPAFIENDRTYVPVRFLSEALGANVEWNENKQEVSIRQ